VILPNQKMFLSLVIRGVAVPSLATLLAGIPAKAQNISGDYVFLIGSGFLCDSGDSSACPAVVKSADGSSFELSGVGTFASHGERGRSSSVCSSRSDETRDQALYTPQPELRVRAPLAARKKA
jgi:hypothetical protein